MKTITIPSTKFLTAIIIAGFLTCIQWHLQSLGQFQFTNTYFGIMAGIAGAQGLLKMAQNVMLNGKNGNGKGNGGGE